MIGFNPREIELILIARGRGLSLLARVGGAILGIGVSLTAMGVAGVRALRDMTQEAAEFQQGAALAFTQVEGVAGASLESIKEAARRVAGEIPQPFEEMTGTLYDIFSTVNVRTMADAEGLLRAFATSASTGQAPMEDISRATMAWMNALELVPNVDNANKLLDIQFELVRKGAGTYEEFAGSIGKSIPAFANAGQEVETFAGILAFLTRNGLSATMASTSAARAAELMFSPKAIKGLKDVGVAVMDDNGQFRQMNEVIADLVPIFDSLTAEERAVQFKEIFGTGSIQARRFFNVALTNYEEMQGYIGDMYGATGNVAEAYNVMFAQPQSQIDLMTNRLQILRTEFGEQFFTVITEKVAPAVQKLWDWWNKLDDIQKANIATWAAWGSAASVAIGIITSIVGAVILLKGLLTVTGSNMGVLGILGMGMGWTAAIAVVIAGLILLVKYWDKIWPWMKETALAIWDWMKRTWEATWNGMKKAWEGFIGFFTGDWESCWKYIAGFFEGIWNKLVGWFKSLWSIVLGWLKSVWEDIVGVASSVWKSVSDAIVTAWQWVYDQLDTIWGPVRDFFVELWTTITFWTKKAWDWISPYLSAIWTWIVDVMRGIWGGIVSFFQTLWNIVSKLFMAAWNTIWSTLKRLWESMIKIGKTLWQTFVKVLGKLWDTISAVWSAAWNGIVSVLERVWDTIKNTAMAFWNLFVGIILKPLTALWAALRGDWDAALEYLKDAWEKIKTAAGNIWEAIKNAVMIPVDATLTALQVTWETIKGWLSTAWEAIKGLAHTLWEGIKTAVMTPVYAIRDGFTNAWNAMRDVALGMWEKIKSGSVDALNWLIRNVFNKFITYMNQMVEYAATGGLGLLPFVNVPDIPQIPEIGSGGGGGRVQQITTSYRELKTALEGLIPKWRTANALLGGSGGGGAPRGRPGESKVSQNAIGWLSTFMSPAEIDELRVLGAEAAEKCGKEAGTAWQIGFEIGFVDKGKTIQLPFFETVRENAMLAAEQIGGSMPGSILAGLEGELPTLENIDTIIAEAARLGDLHNTIVTGLAMAGTMGLDAFITSLSTMTPEEQAAMPALGPEIWRLLNAGLKGFPIHPGASNPLVGERAGGGPVYAGRPYWVGEEGRPELFVPSQNGMIIPENAMGSGQNFYFGDIKLEGDPRELVREIGWMVRYGA